MTTAPAHGGLGSRLEVPGSTESSLNLLQIKLSSNAEEVVTLGSRLDVFHARTNVVIFGSGSSADVELHRSFFMRPS